MQKKLYLATAILACIQVIPPANAQPRNEVGRYAMHKTDDGFIRLDTLTGSVSVCRKAGEGWECRPTPDVSRKLRAEIEQLKDRNAALRQRLSAGRSESPPTPYAPRPDPDHPDDGPPDRKSFQLPSEKQVDQALDYFERMLKKFQDRLKRLERGTAPDKEKQL